MKTPVYLDYAATTPTDPRVAAAMGECLTLDGNFANPASRSHIFGWQAEEAVEAARAAVAELIAADPREIVFTSGATESDNLAIKGAALSRSSRGKHIITAETEHKAVLDTCAWLETQGYEVSYLRPPKSGVIMAEQVKRALRTDTILVSIMHVNNEIGVVNDIAGIGALCRSRQVLLHVDAAQSLGRLDVKVEDLAVDLLSISAHKMYGPKGIGALYVRRDPDIRIVAQMHGGGHERGMRSGTLPTHQIVGLGTAAKIAAQETQSDEERLMSLREQFVATIQQIPQLYINGDLTRRIAGNVNFSVAHVDGESLLTSLRDVAVSTGSACTSVSLEPSYVLTSIGVPADLALSSLRVSFGKFTTQEDITFTAEKIKQVVTKLREVSPSWQALSQAANSI